MDSPQTFCVRKLKPEQNFLGTQGRFSGTPLGIREKVEYFLDSLSIKHPSATLISLGVINIMVADVTALKPVKLPVAPTLMGKK